MRRYNSQDKKKVHLIIKRKSVEPIYDINPYELSPSDNEDYISNYEVFLILLTHYLDPFELRRFQRQQAENYK